MKSAILLLSTAGLALANTAPTVVIQSASMRPGTTLMDVVYRVNDPDDATVKTRALAFVDGVRSFANVIRPVTFVEGTAAKLGDAIPANVDHTLTWDVAADWDIDLGQVKFEVLAMDGRSFLSIDWISIPAAGGLPAMTLSKDTPGTTAQLDALFWQFAGAGSDLSLEGGMLRATGGDFGGIALASGITPDSYAASYLFHLMNLAPADRSEVNQANNAARAGLLNTTKFHAANRPFQGLDLVAGWGLNTSGQISIAQGVTGITAIESGSTFGIALKDDGTVTGWGTGSAVTGIPAGLSGVIKISAGHNHCLALKGDGTVVGWGSNSYGESTIPANLTGVVGIAAGGTSVYAHSLALMSDGTVVGWGSNGDRQTIPPTGLTGVVAIGAGSIHSLALKSDGTVVAWGYGGNGQTNIPAGLSGVTAISTRYAQCLALKSNGTVVSWGVTTAGPVPAGLAGVTAIAAGGSHALALKSDGTVAAWGVNTDGRTSVPAGLTGVTAIAAGGTHSLALKPNSP